MAADARRNAPLPAPPPGVRRPAVQLPAVHLRTGPALPARLPGQPRPGAGPGRRDRRPGGAAGAVGSAGGTGKKALSTGFVVVLGIGIVLFYLSILLIGPFVAVRLNNRAWSATAFPGVRIDCHMGFWGYFRLQLVNVLLTLLTLGLFRPFAAVRTWRYRIEHLRIDAPGGFEQATHAARRRPAAAAGDGVADFIGVDLSW
ncbi:MAG: DUF898 family protein [Oxalobacteraceae bacterium]|nr:MAG: DUF898 family protein [Oxalobacteraceae bacterium]